VVQRDNTTEPDLDVADQRAEAAVGRQHLLERRAVGGVNVTEELAVRRQRPRQVRLDQLPVD
jgi:hypothetical protein